MESRYKEAELNLTPQKDDQEQSKAEEEKQEEEKGEEKRAETPEKEEDSDNENKPGCVIGFQTLQSLRGMVKSPMERLSDMEDTIKCFKFTVPRALARKPEKIITETVAEEQKRIAEENWHYQKLMRYRSVIRSLHFTNKMYFPHKQLVQYDCGKLQKLSELLKQLKRQKSKVLIFTQMTKMLDLLEKFLNLYGYPYVRLDGSVKVEMRQKLVDNFNLNP
jgi:E1A-binding protein p400